MIKEPETSREKILEAACQLFAEKGYKKTTIRDICKAADTYQISINYYFGSKENLFKEVLSTTYSMTEESILAQKIKDFNPEEQLRKIVKTRLNTIFRNDKSKWFFEILCNEDPFTDETYDDIFKNTLEKHMEFVKGIFRKLLGENSNEFKESYCMFVLMSQIITLAKHKKAKDYFFGETAPAKVEIDVFAEQITKFLLAGVEQMKLEEIRI
ncbi:MAG: TetR/AcrR family transcriptional regulator [Candidatus Gastranaerophilales bacterium]|nr:TetR/AcrR family transcriptional regulator [Candidatus Gastranaerophilales bacterium]